MKYFVIKKIYKNKIFCLSEHFVEKEKVGNYFVQGLVNMVDGVEKRALIHYLLLVYFCWMWPCLIMLYSHVPYHNDSIIVKTDARRKIDAWRITQEWRTHEDFFRKIFTSHFIARIRKGCWRVACERMLETEHKLHILTPLSWPSRCVFLVLLDAQPEVLGSTPSGLFRGPPRSGVAFPTTSGLYCLEVYWQLLWDPNSTELNNNSTLTRSPTGSLKSNV